MAKIIQRGDEKNLIKKERDCLKIKRKVKAIIVVANKDQIIIKSQAKGRI
jgi:hypothetical protein